MDERQNGATLTLETTDRGIDEHPRRRRRRRAPAPIPGIVGDEATVRAVPSPHHAQVAQAAFNRQGPLGANGDEQDFPTRIGNYHKGLKHDRFGEVRRQAYDALVQGLNSRASGQAFENAIVPERDTPPFGRPLTNPQAGFSGDTEGPPPHSLQMAAPPKLNSAEAGGEAVELYWMALLRDVPFARFDNHPQVAQAAADLSKLSDFRGPKDESGQVTPATIFRGSAIGDLVGPYVSQFLLKEIPYGSLTIDQRQTTARPDHDYLTAFEEWRDVQNGLFGTLPPDDLDDTPRYIRSMRDLGQYVHVDALYEAYLNACLILLGLGAPVDDGNPYKATPRQIGFATFGGPHILSLVTEVATRALKAVWYQKWAVHRRLRPEAYGGLVHLRTLGFDGTVKTEYPIHDDVLNSDALTETFSRHGSHLLPMAFPEGSPTHPAYGAGHATVAGACVTVLKAWFDEDWTIPDPVQASANGRNLEPYAGSPLTVGGELNKVAANIAIGRNMAGVHWRTDYVESLKLGERVAIAILQEQASLYHERRVDTGGPMSFTFTKFDGSQVTIEPGP